MKKTLLLSLSLMLGLTISAQEVQWAKLITSTARDGIWETQISPTGDLLVLGFFEADLELDGEILQHEDNQDFFLVDYTTAGELQWVIPFTGQNFDRGDCLTFDEDGNIFLGAVFTESIQVPGGTISGNDVADVLLMAFQPDGDLGWEYHFGGTSYDYCYGVYVGGNELLAVGHFNETVDFGFGDVTSEGQQDMWLMSLKTTNGQPNWVKTFGGDVQDRLYSVVKDPDGNIIVCGYFGGT
ncbi:MAG: hypothetical protein KDC44_12135, partial [Phaeodactylibacter sp.]|nr:hypothetical protein [Phaeodactylibacter sp.]